jgi:hypothetical protein
MQKSHSYVVIGAFPTETSTTGVPLAVLWKVEAPINGIQLEVLFTEGFDQVIGPLELSQRKWVDELVRSLRTANSRTPEQLSALFERLSNLSIGPVRTMVRGCSSFHGKASHFERFAAVLKRLEME